MSIHVGEPRQSWGRMTDSGAESSWQRIEGEGSPHDYSAGPTFDGDYRPRLTVVPAPPVTVPEPPSRPQKPTVVNHPPEWNAGRWMAFTETVGPYGREGRWTELEPPPVTSERADYLFAKQLRAAGDRGLAALRAALADRKADK